MKDLRLAFTRAGLFNGTNSIYFTIKISRLEKRGRLKVPRNESGHRRFTAEQIAEIVTAFSPGGKGCFYYKKPEVTQKEIKFLKDAVIQDKIDREIEKIQKERTDD
jgi:hypothetical protein